tara:strand:+ start:3156 stop:3311 length:156 start_codon:yes stop_codon:yes gene_type:complete
MNFNKGDLVIDSLGRLGVVVSYFKTFAGVFYNVLIDGVIESLPEEELFEKK